MLPRNRWGHAPGGTWPEKPDTGRTIRLVRPPVQQQLHVFAWITTSYPVWWKRPAHRAMMDRTWSRILAEEAHE